MIIASPFRYGSPENQVSEYKPVDRDVLKLLCAKAVSKHNDFRAFVFSLETLKIRSPRADFRVVAWIVVLGGHHGSGRTG